MFNLKIPYVFLAVIILLVDISAQFQPVANRGAAHRIFPVAELREGMTGTARTVFQGSKSEEFKVEIIGVIPNWIGPKQDMIVGKLSGANAERTSVFAGMSGSPVYIDGRLVGAISYSFPFSKEPICGITPFEQMASVVEHSMAANPVPAKRAAFSYAELLANTWQPNLAQIPVRPVASGFSADSRLTAVAGQTMLPISTPLYFSGISQQTLDRLAPELTRAGLMPIAAAGGNSRITPMTAATETTLLGGDSVVVSLARGDIQIAAAGTVTLRDGEKIYAFGHPFFSLGASNLPMSESHVIVVIPNANNSFKLAVPDATVGSMTQDRATTIFGKLGEAPRMLPVNINLVNSRGVASEINFESAFDELLTPLIINAGVGNALSAQERGLGDTTIELNGEIKIKGEDSIRINRRFAGPQALIFASSAPAIPLALLLRANFAGMEITGVKLDMTAIDGSKTATLDRISVDKTEVRPGETVEVTSFTRTESGNIVIKKIPIMIPKDTAPGEVSIMIGDGNAAQQNSAVTQFVPKSAAELIAMMNRLKRSDRLYAVLSRTSAGAIIGASELPNLPPSFLATLNNQRTTGGSKPSIQTIIAEKEIEPGEFIITGSQSISINIVR